MDRRARDLRLGTQPLEHRDEDHRRCPGPVGGFAERKVLGVDHDKSIGHASGAPLDRLDNWTARIVALEDQ